MNENDYLIDTFNSLNNLIIDYTNTITIINNNKYYNKLYSQMKLMIKYHRILYKYLCSKKIIKKECIKSNVIKKEYNKLLNEMSKEE